MELLKKELKETTYTIQLTEEELKQIICSFATGNFARINEYAKQHEMEIDSPHKYNYLVAQLIESLNK